MLNISMLTALSTDSYLPLLPSLLGGRYASKLRLQLIELQALPDHLRSYSDRLMNILDHEIPQNEREAEDLEEYCTYLHGLVRSVDGARGIPILRLAQSWYRFRDAYMELFLLPPHLLMPYLDQKIQRLHNLLVDVENEIRNPNLEYSEAEQEHERAILKANHTRVYLLECILKDDPLRNALQQMVEAEDRLERTRFDRRFPDYVQGRLMSNNQLNQMERNLMLNQPQPQRPAQE
jgi:hypothetical protein